MNSFRSGGLVSQVHSGQQLEPTDKWPFMRTSVDSPSMMRQTEAEAEIPRPRARHQPIRRRRRQMEEDEIDESDGSSPPDEEADPYSKYAKLVKSNPVLGPIGSIPKYVFKVRETTKLLLFAAVAIGGVMLLDLSVKLMVAASNVKCSREQQQNKE